MKSVGVNDQSGVAEARRAVNRSGRRAGFTRRETGRLALVATELATNLVKHGGGGEILVGTYDGRRRRRASKSSRSTRARGMSNVARMPGRRVFERRHAPAHGLGAVDPAVAFRRHRFVARRLARPCWPALAPGSPVAASRRPRLDAGVASPFPRRARKSAATPGALSKTGHGPTLLVADGSGPRRRRPRKPRSRRCGCSIAITATPWPMLIDYIHGGLRATRGAAVSIARFDRRRREDQLRRHRQCRRRDRGRPGETKRMVSMPGTAGYQRRARSRPSTIPSSAAW